MAKQKMSTKKKASAIVAGALAVALAVGGAYAWTDYSQSARNTFNGAADAAVLLHDDFDGENKDVYVENTGTGSVYVRVKFAEYLQIGNESVLTAYGENADATDPVKADPNDVSTWPVHQFTSAAADDNTCTTKSAHTYFNWNMSGEEKDYLAGVTEADGNGYGGLSQEAFEGFTTNPAGTADPQGPITIGNITTYKYASLATTEIITMAEWYDLRVKALAGSLTTDEDTRWQEINKDGRWILDSDGWAYWSKALAPNTATNLLLDKVSVKDTAPHDNWIYNIDVQLQAATPNDLNAWIRDNSNADIDRTVASPDNSIATATDNAFEFLSYLAGGTLTTADGYVLDSLGRKYSGAGANVYLLLDSATNKPVNETAYILAGQDGQPGTEDDNTLSGRSLDNNGGLTAGIGVTNINPEDGTYEIDPGTDGDATKLANIVVTSGIDKKMGTYDDVIISKDAANPVLGACEIDGTDADEDLVGWYYLGGPVGKMLVTTEYVLDNTPFNASGAAEPNNYRGSALETKIKELGDDIAIASDYVHENVEVTMEKSVGNKVYVCLADHDHTVSGNCTSSTYGYGAYFTDGSYTLDETSLNATYFALSINEVLAAYGDSSTDAAVLVPRRAQGAPAQLNPKVGDWSASYLYHYQSYKDGNGDLISTTYYWLRSPGHTGTRASYVYCNGHVYAYDITTHGFIGARPACYLNLGS